jgi:uncharacterized membrane protein YfcA
MIDWPLTLVGFPVGLVVGLTGMGGGALLTPILVLFFGVHPLTAVSSDLVASMVMKPVGGGVHLRRGTVRLDLVKWLAIGSVPSAFLAVFALRRFGSPAALEGVVKQALGAALALAVSAMFVKGVLQRRRVPDGDDAHVAARPLVTALIGALGGGIVGLTSVGSGSLIIVLMMVAYPRLSARALVGTDLVQAVPLVASAGIAHLLFGSVELGLTASLLIGSLPGVWLGAHISARAADAYVRPVITLILTASAAKLLGAGNGLTVAVLALVAAVGGTRIALRRRAQLLAGSPSGSSGTGSGSGGTGAPSQAKSLSRLA